jgi:hypothetical protein
VVAKRNLKVMTTQHMGVKSFIHFFLENWHDITPSLRVLWKERDARVFRHHAFFLRKVTTLQRQRQSLLIKQGSEVRWYVRRARFSRRPSKIGKLSRSPSGVFDCLVVTFVFAPLQLTSCPPMPFLLSPLSGGDPWEASGRRRDALEPAAGCPRAGGAIPSS